MLKEKEYIEKEIASIQKVLKELPEGKISCAKNGRSFKWYQFDGQKQTYIPKKNRKLAEQLAKRKHLLLRLKYLLQEQRAIDSYLRNHVETEEKVEALLNDPAYAELLEGYFKPASKELADWMYEPYDKNTKYPEKLTHKIGKNIAVRSKSEAMIAMLLYTNKIPFRYECALTLSGITFYPDFTIRHPKTGKIYYWENFGMMDKKDYCEKTFSKMEIYLSHEIIPNINFITTFETKEEPLNTEQVQKLIEFFFLDK